MSVLHTGNRGSELGDLLKVSELEIWDIDSKSCTWVLVRNRLLAKGRGGRILFMGTRSGLPRGWMCWKGEGDKGQGQPPRPPSQAWPGGGVRSRLGDTIPRQSVAVGLGSGSFGIRLICFL